MVIQGTWASVAGPDHLFGFKQTSNAYVFSGDSCKHLAVPYVLGTCFMLCPRWIPPEVPKAGPGTMERAVGVRGTIHRPLSSDTLGLSSGSLSLWCCG